MKKRFGKNDCIFLGTLFLILLASCAWFYFFGKEDGAVAEVTVDGQLYGAYSLERDQTVEIVIGEKVKNVLQIKDGRADMTSADCPDKLCVHQRAVSKQNETIVCLPNKVVVEIIGGQKADVDALI